MELTRKLRIAVLSRNFVATGGGAERYAIALVEQLAAQHEVHVFAQTIQHQHPKVQYHSMGTPLRRPRWVNQLYFSTRSWWATRKGFDIVHSHENTWHGNVQTVHVLPVKHNLFYNKTGFRLALRWLKVLTSPRLLVYLALEKARYQVRHPKAIISVSQTLQHIMQQAYPQAVSAMQVIPPGIDAVPGIASPEEQAAARKMLNLPTQGHCILFAGNDFKKKGLPTLIQAMTQLPENVFLAVAGQSGQRSEMERAAAEAAITHRVHFLGAVSDMHTAYTAADGLVHPTLEDTYAMVVLEAMSHGLPVVVSNEQYCGIAAELTHEFNALLVQNPQDKDELAKACKKIIFNKDTATTLRQHALEFVANKLWYKVAFAHLSVYNDCVAHQT